jgi:hypothetical protein
MGPHGFYSRGGRDRAKHFSEYPQNLREIAESCATYRLVTVFDAVTELLAGGLRLVFVFSQRQLSEPEGCQLSAIHAHAATSVQGSSISMVRAQDTLMEAVVVQSLK